MKVRDLAAAQGVSPPPRLCDLFTSRVRSAPGAASTGVATMAALGPGAAGIARARSEGKRIGRPPKTSPSQRSAMIASLAAGTSVSALARQYGISRASVIAARLQHQGAEAA